MPVKSVLFLLVSLLFTGLAFADADLRVTIVSSQIQGSTELGKTHVDGLGEVSFIGSKNGNQVIVHAQDPDGKVIGKADTVIGLNQTPIYVLTDGGLKKITIYWGSN